MSKRATDSHLIAILSRDPVMRVLVRSHEPIVMTKKPIYPALVKSIISQQLSKAAATTIFNRLKAITPITPSALHELGVTSYRACGISQQKAVYIKAISASAHADGFKNIGKLSDDEVIRQLLQYKGVGHWTAQMVLIFALARTDVWPHEDAGLIRAAKGLFKIVSVEEFIQLGDRFRPYRSYAACHLWRYLDSK